MQNRPNTLDSAYRRLIDRLRTVRRQWRWLIFAEGLLKSICLLALTLTGTLLLLEANFQLWHAAAALWIGVAVLLIAAGSAIYGIVRLFVLPMLRKLTDARVAARMETAELDTENRVLSAVQLWGTLSDNRFGYAPEFVEQLVLQASRDVESVKPRGVFSAEIQRIQRSAGAAIGGVGLLVLTYLLLPVSLTGFAQTFQTLPSTLQAEQTVIETLVQITDVQPGTVHIERGESVAVRAQIKAPHGAAAQLYYRIGTDDETETDATWQPLPMDRDGTAYTARLENIMRPLQYYVSVQGVTSDRYQVRLRNAPHLTRFQYRLHYPAYTGVEPQTLPENVGDLQALFGTEVLFTGESNKPLETASLAFEESGDVALAVASGAETDVAKEGARAGSGSLMHGSFLAQESGNYRILMTDVDGFTNRDPIHRTLTVLQDAAPEVAIIAPDRDTLLDDAMLINLEIAATDDYGIQALELVYRVESEGTEPVTLPLKRWETQERTIAVMYRWDVDPIGLFPGETLAYYVQASDTDNVSGPNVGRSATYTLRFPSLSELYQGVAAEQAAEQGGLDELIDDQADATGAVDALLDKIRKSQELTLNDENLMEQVLENQKQIEETAEALIEDMKETAAEMEKHQLFDAETLEKYEELQELMEQALSEEHKALLQKLAEALAEQDIGEQESSMTEANLSQEQFLQQLERAKALYEQILLEQALEAAVEQAKALAEQQQTLMDTLAATTQAQPMPKLAAQESLIGEAFTALSTALDDLGTKMQELAEKNENAPPQIERLAAEILRLNEFAHEHRLPEMLQRTGERLQSGKREMALESGRNAEQTLSELAQGLENALAFMEGENANETLEALQTAVESGLYLSHRHEAVMARTNAILTGGQAGTYIASEILRLQQLAADELTASESLTRLSNQLWELGNRQIQVPPEAIFHLNAANDSLARAARALEDRQPGLAVPIQISALADLNQAVFVLLNALGEMNQQMGASGLENMMEQLQQLAESQEQLNEMVENLSRQLREQGRTPGVDAMMQQLAAQQEMIREATERIAERAEAMAEMLGSLEDVAEEMASVEQSLREGELDESVLDRQSQILTRMLESLKSLQKRDVGRQRKAEVAEADGTPLSEVPPLHRELLEIVRQLEGAPTAKEFETIPFQYREQLRRYFKALSGIPNN